MIDYFDIRLNHKFTDDDVAPIIADESLSHSRYSRRVTNPAWMSHAIVVIERKNNHWAIRICCCPAKILGSWNSIGSSDLHDLVMTTLPRIFSTANIRWTDSIDKTLINKNYCIREIHIANIMRLEKYSHSEFVDKLFYALGPTKKPTYAKRGKGLVISSNNRNVTTYIYVKHIEIKNKGMPAYARRMKITTGVSKVMLALDRRFQMAAALLGPRLEFRFGDQFFRNNKLQHPNNWTADTAQMLFKSQLLKLRLPGSVAVLPNRTVIEERLAGTPAYATALLWHHGEAVHGMLSRSTLKRHAAIIMKALAVDITQPYRCLSQLAEIGVESVLNVENIVEKIDLDDPEIACILQIHSLTIIGKSN